MTGPGLLDVRFAPLDVLAPLAVSILMFAGVLKATPILSELPFDLTLFGALLVLLLIGVEVLRKDWRPPPGVAAVVFLWAVFLVGVWQTSESQYAGEKVQRLFTLTLLSAIGPLLLLRSELRQRIWLWSLVGLGALTAAAAVLFPSDETAETGRLVAEGSNTISAGQAAGAAALILYILAATRCVRRMVAIPAAVAFTGVAVLTGSKGPLLAMVVALAILVVARPGTRAVRSRRVIGSLAAGAAVFVLVAVNLGSAVGFERITALVTQPDEVREFLYARSFEMALENPLGIGWGNFATELHTNFVFETAQDQILYPHDALLEVAVEAGWLAVLAFAVFVVVSLYRLLRRSGTTNGALLFTLALYFFFNSLVSGDINGNKAMLGVLALAWLSSTSRPTPTTDDLESREPAPDERVAPPKVTAGRSR